MSPSSAVVAAVDLGASSGRVVVGRCSAQGMELREVHRFVNQPVRAGARLRWDVLSLFAGITEGLRLAERAVGPLDSVGVDSWAVDYGLLDADSELLGNPLSYRDARTETAIAEVVATIGAGGLYAATGIQHQPFNTVFQLLAERDSAQMAAATRALLIPDLMSHWLGGDMGTELTNASTMALIDPRTRTWSADLAARLRMPLELFAPLRPPGEIIGMVTPGLGLAGNPRVITVPSHDTAAAVAGIPATSEDFAYVSTGTWALVGLELPAPVITEASRAANFTNELGVDGTVRFLRNVTGFWLLQECVRQWRADGLQIDLGALTEAARATPALVALIDVQDPAFAAPGDMPRRIQAACLRDGGFVPTTPAEITRAILDSMAVAIRQAVRAAVQLSGRSVSVVHMVGGGVANTLFCQLVADACQLPVLAGPTEAAAWGNAIFQARAIGVLNDSLADSRALIARTERPVTYAVADDETRWEKAERAVLKNRANT